jgi:hypothetical protein
MHYVGSYKLAVGIPSAVNSGRLDSLGLLGSRSFCTPAAPRGIEPGSFQWPFKCGRATSIKSSMV